MEKEEEMEEERVEERVDERVAEEEVAEEEMEEEGVMYQKCCQIKMAPYPEREESALWARKEYVVKSRREPLVLLLRQETE